MYCTNCGNKLDVDSKFCNKCGHPVAETGGEEESAEKVDEVDESKETEEVEDAEEAKMEDGHDGLAEKIEEQVEYDLAAETDSGHDIPQEVQDQLLGKKQKPKKSKKVGIGIGIALAILLALSATAFAFKDSVMYNLMPKQYAMATMGKTLKSVNKEMEKIEDILLNDFVGKSNTSEMEIMIKDISTTDPFMDMTFGLLKNAGLNIKSSRDYKNKVAYIEGNAVFGGKNFLSLNARLDDQDLLFSFPELYGRSFSMPSKDFGQKWNNSSLAKNTSTYLDEDLDISFSNLMAESEMELIEMDSQTKMDYIEAMRTMIQNASFEKNGQEDLLIGGKYLNHKKIKVELKSSDLKNGLIELIQALENDNRLLEMRKILSNSQTSYLLYDIDQGLADLKYELEYLPEIDEIVLDLYTRGGLARKMELQVTPDFYYSEDRISLSSSFLGEKDIMDDFQFSFVVGDDMARIDINSEKDPFTGRNHSINRAEMIVYDYGYELIRVNILEELDLSKKEDNLKLGGEIIGEGMFMSLDASGDFTSSSKEVLMNLHDVSFIMEELYYNERIMIEGSIMSKIESKAMKLPKVAQEDKVQIFELLEYDVYEIMERVGLNLQNLGRSLNLF